MVEVSGLHEVWLHSLSFYKYGPYDIDNAHLKYVMYSKNCVLQDPLFYFVFRSVDSFDKTIYGVFFQINFQQRNKLQDFRQNTYLYYIH